MNLLAFSPKASTRTLQQDIELILEKACCDLLIMPGEWQSHPNLDYFKTLSKKDTFLFSLNLIKCLF